MDSPNERDRYEVLVDGPRTELRVKGSKFFGQVYSVDTEEQARQRLDAIRKVGYDATHHCWAMRIGDEGDEHERFDDDGEPSGTAGSPIGQALRADGRANGLVVVTRYYGGTKLGTGGLIRAYGDSARLALEAAPSRTMWRESLLRLQMQYDDIGVVEAVLARRAAWIRGVERSFDSEPEVRIRVLLSRTAELQEQLVEESAGRVEIHAEPND